MNTREIQQKCDAYFVSRKGEGYCARCSNKIKDYGEVGVNILFCPKCFTMWLDEFEEYMIAGCKTPERREKTTFFEGTHRKLRAKYLALKPVREQDPPKIAEVKKEAELVINQECCVCLDEKKIMSFVPCGHLAICKTCHATQKWEKCPMCNQNCTMVIQIFS